MKSFLKLLFPAWILLVCVNSSAIALTAEEQQEADEATYDLIIGPGLKKFDAGTNTIDYKSPSSILGALVGGDGGEIAFEIGDVFKSEKGEYFNIKFVAPLEEDASRDLGGTLDALKNKARASVAWQKVRIPRVHATANAVLTKIGVCQSFLRSQQESVLSDQDRDILAFNLDSIDPALSKISNPNDQNTWITENLSNTAQSVLFAADGACSDHSVFRGNRSYEKLFDQALTDHATYPFYLYGVEATLASDNYSYFNEGDLTNQITDNELDYAIKFYGGRLYDSGSYLGIAATFQESFTNQDPQEVCTTTALNDCEDKVIGAPASEQTKLISLSYSRLFQSYGLQFKVTRDLDKDVTGISVPIWLKKKIGDELSTGVQFDWNSEDKDARAMLFLNKSFNLFGGT